MPFDPMVLIAVLFPATLVVILIIVIADQKINKKKYAEMQREIDEKTELEFDREADVVTMHAEIVDMVCGTGMVGSYRLPKHVKTFLIAFKNDDGDSFEISVPEAYYLELAVGQTGVLTLCEGNLDSFVLDENSN